MDTLTKTLLLRFIRGFVSGALGATAIIAPAILATWKDLAGWLTTLGLAAVAGGITGGLQALDKAIRWNE